MYAVQNNSFLLLCPFSRSKIYEKFLQKLLTIISWSLCNKKYKLRTVILWYCLPCFYFITLEIGKYPQNCGKIEATMFKIYARKNKGSGN